MWGNYIGIQDNTLKDVLEDLEPLSKVISVNLSYISITVDTFLIYVPCPKLKLKHNQGSNWQKHILIWIITVKTLGRKSQKENWKKKLMTEL